MNDPEHPNESSMKFRRIGGSSQLVIESADDFRNAYELDPAHWTLTSIPAKNLLCPAEFLALIPQDASGRIHVKDVRNLLKWVISTVADLEDFITAAPALRLAALNVDDADGLRAKETAELALKRIGSKTPRPSPSNRSTSSRRSFPTPSKMATASSRPARSRMRSLPSASSSPWPPSARRKTSPERTALDLPSSMPSKAC